MTRIAHRESRGELHVGMTTPGRMERVFQGAERDPRRHHEVWLDLPTPSRSKRFRSAGEVCEA